MNPLPTPPPHWAVRLLRWHCHPELLEEIQGDLSETYADRVARHGVGYARRCYVYDVLKFIRPFARESPNAPAFPASRIELIKNYSHLSVRYLRKHRGFFILNVLGLAIGIAACLIIVHHERKYQTERRMLTLFNYFSGLSLLVACLGLLGLTATIVQQKTKEIGIRKVLGAGRTAIMYLLSREFGMLLLLSALIATPLAYLAMRYWLRSFAYQTSIGMPVFLLSVGGVALVALLTLSYHTLKAAATNPVDSLRHE